MGRVKELWMQKIEDLCREYGEGLFSYEEAMYHLMALGLDPHDAANWLDSARTMETP